MDELRMAIRRLKKRPSAVIASVVTLAGSIGAAGAAWSVLSAALLHPLHVPDADRLVVIGAIMTGPKGPFTNTGFTYPMLPAVRDSGAFAEVTFGGTIPAQITANGDTRSRSIFFVTSNFFGTIRVPVQLGRDFTANDDGRGVAPVAILSDRLWRTALAADPDIVGKTIGVEHRPVRVIGVAARGFAGMSVTVPADLFLPLHTVGDAVGTQSNPFAEPSIRNSPSTWVTAFGRMRASDRAEAVAAELGSIVPGLNGRPVTLLRHDFHDAGLR